LGGLDIWYDDITGRLNKDNRGKHIGNFQGEDLILVIDKKGNYELTNFELTNRYEADEVIFIQKFNPKSTIGAVYFDGTSKSYFVKRFQIETSTIDKKFNFISDHKASYLALVTIESDAQIEISLTENGKNEVKIIDLDLLIDVKGWKAIGNRLQYDKIKKIKLLASNKENDQEDGGNKDDKAPEKFDVGSQITFSADKDDQLGLF
jgi:topoisomerase-4 subunit A